VNGAPLAVLSVGNLVIGTGAFVLVGMLGAMAVILGGSLRAFDGRRSRRCQPLRQSAGAMRNTPPARPPLRPA